MATAQRTTVTKMIPMEVTGYTLTLTEQEAVCLRDICNNIAGCPEKSRRAYTDRINAALKAAGVGRGPLDCSGTQVKDLTRTDRMSFIAGPEVL